MPCGAPLMEWLAVDLNDIFTADVIDRLEKHRHESVEMDFRLDVLNGPKVRSTSPADLFLEAGLRWKRELWQHWLRSASNCAVRGKGR